MWSVKTTRIRLTFHFAHAAVTGLQSSHTLPKGLFERIVRASRQQLARTVATVVHSLWRLALAALAARPRPSPHCVSVNFRSTFQRAKRACSLAAARGCECGNGGAPQPELSMRVIRRRRSTPPLHAAPLAALCTVLGLSTVPPRTWPGSALADCGGCPSASSHLLPQC